MTAAKRSKAKWIITIVSFVMSIIMFSAFIFGIFTKPGETTENVGTSDYGFGNIDDAGKVVQSYKAMYMKDMQTVTGLDIEVNDETSVLTYKVVFYDEEKAYVSATETLSDDFDATSIPENAKYFRVVIIPNQIDGEDVILNIFNVSNYAKKLAVSYTA